jgi:hypothetical protein
MNLNEILALYDHEMRREAKIYKGHRQVLPELTRLIFDDPKRKSFISHYNFPEEEATSIIEREITYFKELGRVLEWSTYGHNSPPDLHVRLAEYGFEIEDEMESIMVLDLSAPPALLLDPPTADVRRILDPAGLDDVMAVEEAVWNTDYSWLKNKLSEDLVERPEEVAVYVVYVDEKPVASGWMF